MKKGIKVIIPFQASQMEGTIVLNLINENGLKTQNILLINKKHPEKKIYLDQQNISLIQDAQYNSDNHNDTHQGFSLSSWLIDNFGNITKEYDNENIIFQEMTLEEFLSQSIKQLKLFAIYNPKITNIKKYFQMLTWNEEI